MLISPESSGSRATVDPGATRNAPRLHAAKKDLARLARMSRQHP
jgi:hypothetical protein